MSTTTTTTTRDRGDRYGPIEWAQQPPLADPAMRGAAAKVWGPLCQPSPQLVCRLCIVMLMDVNIRFDSTSTFVKFDRSEGWPMTMFFSARCNIYISRLCHDASPSVRLSVTEVHWRIIANLGSNSDPTLPRIAAAVLLAGAVLLAVLLVGESSRAMLASARLSCLGFAGCPNFVVTPLFREHSSSLLLLGGVVADTAYKRQVV